MNGVSKITVTEDISLVNFKNISRDLSVASRIMTEFSEQGINIDMISQSAPTGETADVSFTIDSKDLVRTLSIVQRFRVQYPNVRPSVSSGCCKIQLYGEEMRARTRSSKYFGKGRMLRAYPKLRHGEKHRSLDELRERLKYERRH